MVDFRSDKMTFFLTLLLQSTAVTGQGNSLISLTVRDGDDVMLPSGHEMNEKNTCDGISWILAKHPSVDLVTQGKMFPNSQFDPERLNLAANCSLVIRKVTAKDAGVYHCQLTGSSPDTQLPLAVVQITEQEQSEQVTLSCSVAAPEWCRHKVRWLFEGGDEIAQTETCHHTVMIPSRSKHNSKCEVTDGYKNKILLFGLRTQSSDGEPDKNTMRASSTTTTTTKTTTMTKTTTEEAKIKGTNSKWPAMNGTSQTLKQKTGWWWYVIAAIGSVALVIIIVMFIQWKKSKVKKSKTADYTGLSLNPAVTPQSAPDPSHDKEDPEDGVSYVSVSYTKRISGKAQVKNDEEEGDAVTYSTVKAYSSSAGASADEASIYATVNKQTK